MIFISNENITMKNSFFSYFVVFVMLLTSCGQNDQSGEDAQIDTSHTVDNSMLNSSFSPDNQQSVDYSLTEFAGKAEICTYELSRARYNDNHPGEAVLIFVTEPFLPNDQVKSDQGATEETIKVLKMNKIDRFSTGVYDYAMFTSVFTPIEKFDPSYPLKISFSSQDWCGQVFSQLNNSKGYEYSQYSYFQKEGDTSIHYDYALPEENIFNLSRIDTALLPNGSFKVFPAQSYTRTSHIQFKAYTANSSKGTKDSLIVYNYEIPELKRSVRLLLDPNNSMKIVKWTETYPTVFDGKLRTSTYTLKSSFLLPYWNLNETKDGHLRDSLGIIRYD